MMKKFLSIYGKQLDRRYQFMKVWSTIQLSAIIVGIAVVVIAMAYVATM